MTPHDKWTPEFYGLSHLGDLLAPRRVSLQVFSTGRALLSKFTRTEGSPGNHVQRTRTEASFDSADAARVEGARWVKEGDR